MNFFNIFLFSSELSQTFLGIMAGATFFFLCCTFVFPKIRQKTQNKALKKTLARSKKFPGIFSALFLMFLLLRLENSHMWIGWRLWLILLSLFALFWISRKILFYIQTKKRIESAEKRRKRKKK